VTNANGPQDLRRGGEAEAVSVLAEEFAAGMEEATVEKCRERARALRARGRAFLTGLPDFGCRSRHKGFEDQRLLLGTVDDAAFRGVRSGWR
jgi:hypothetical protein